MASTPEISVLVVDDDAGHQRRLVERLAGLAGWKARVQAESTAEGALATLKALSLDLVFLDLSLPDASGLSALERLRQLHPKTAVVAVTPQASGPQAVAAMKKGALDYLSQAELAEADLGQLCRRVIEQRYLVDQNMELRQLSQLKTEFIANVSHELRTPLSVIIGFAQTLRGGSLGPVNEAQGKALDSIVARSEDLLKTLNLILRVRESQEGKQQLVLAPMELREFLTKQARRPPREFARKKIQLETDLAAGEAWVRADEGRLAETVENLLSNAAKFGPEGSLVRLSLSVSEGQALVGVSDQGPGIAPEMLPKVFEQFSAAGHGPTREHAGLGLGLPLARQIVEQHAGRIWLESKPGATTAFIALPLSPKDLPRLAVAAPAAIEKKRVLVVEDNPDILEILVLFLSTISPNLEVETAQSGPEALDAIKNRVPHAIILDVMMPGMNGFEVIDRLRRSEQTRAIPVMVLTGYQEAAARAKACGAQEVLLKPFEKKAFADRLMRLLAAPPADTPQTPA